MVFGVTPLSPNQRLFVDGKSKTKQILALPSATCRNTKNAHGIMLATDIL